MGTPTPTPTWAPSMWTALPHQHHRHLQHQHHHHLLYVHHLHHRHHRHHRHHHLQRLHLHHHATTTSHRSQLIFEPGRRRSAELDETWGSGAIGAMIDM